MAPAAYQVLEYVAKPSEDERQQFEEIYTPKEYVWRIAEDFKIKNLPEQSALEIKMLDQTQALERLELAQGPHRESEKLNVSANHKTGEDIGLCS